MKKVFFSWRGGADIYNYANEGGRRGGVGGGVSPMGEWLGAIPRSL